MKKILLFSILLINLNLNSKNLNQKFSDINSTQVTALAKAIGSGLLSKYSIEHFWGYSSLIFNDLRNKNYDRYLVNNLLSNGVGAMAMFYASYFLLDNTLFYTKQVLSKK